MYSMRKVNKVVAAAIAASMMVLSVSGLFTANEISKDEIMPSSELVQEESTEHMQVSGNTLEPEEQETTDEALNYEETSQSDEAIAYDEELTIEPRNTDVPPDFVSVKERNWDIIGEEDPGYGNYVSFMEEAFFNGYMNIDGVNTSTGNNIIIWGSPTNSDGIHTTVGDCVPGYTFEDYEGYYFTSNGNGYYRCPSTNIKKVGVDKSKWVMQKKLLHHHAQTRITR